jgi:hypothetical protein
LPVDIEDTSKRKLKDKKSKEPVGNIEKTQVCNKQQVVQSITLAPITTWIEKQLINQRIPKSVKRQIISSYEKFPDEKFPDGLMVMAIPSTKK